MYLPWPHSCTSDETKEEEDARPSARRERLKEAKTGFERKPRGRERLEVLRKALYGTLRSTQKRKKNKITKTRE